jgi:hypothetical protein
MAERTGGDPFFVEEVVRPAGGRQRRRRPRRLPHVHEVLALALLAQGNGDAAAAAANEAVDVAHRQGARVLEAEALITRAHVTRRVAAAARADFDAASLLVTQIGAATLEPFIQEARLENDPAALADAGRRYEAVGAAGHARRLTTELGRQGRPDPVSGGPER